MKIFFSVLFLTNFLMISHLEFARPTTKYIFDLPSLKGKNIEAVTEILGKPSQELKPTALEIKNHITGIKFFTRGKYVLDVKYFADSKKVESFFLGEKNIVNDCKSLIAVVNLVNTTVYYIEPVRAQKDHSKFTGITITPK